MSRAITLGLVLLVGSLVQAADGTRHYLYVAEPGVRDYVECGGAGILVFDIDHGHTFVNRIETPASREAKPDNIKGICANAANRRLYFTTTKQLYCLDLVTEQTLWEKSLPQGCDRHVDHAGRQNALRPVAGAGHLERRRCRHRRRAVPDRDSERRPQHRLRPRRHADVPGRPEVAAADGRRSSRRTRSSGQVGPFAAGIRPFTVNGAQTLCYVNVNDLLGFEVGDLKTGKKLARVEVQGFEKGPVKRHGCPSHGIGLTPDEKELWVCDAHNSRMHVFDTTVDPPKQIASISAARTAGLGDVQPRRTVTPIRRPAR